MPLDPSHPPIILISFDTCRADLFGVLTGEEPSLTPNLDQFAQDAVIFDKAFVQISHTLPSHMSLMTSAYPDSHGVKPDKDPLSESFTTLPQILQEAGYHTVGLVTTEWLKEDFGFGRGFDHYERISHRPTYVERVNKAALKRMDPEASKPTFLFLHYYDLHSDFEHFPSGNNLPYYSPEEYRKGLAVSEDGSEFCDAEGVCNTRYLMGLDKAHEPLSPDKVELIHALYRAAMPHLDHHMGAFFEALKANGLYDRSLILITSDHGEEFREHGRFIHSQPYDETLHVPLFIKFPNAWKAGTRVSTVAETVDILPTLVDFLDLEAPTHAQGESLLPRIESDQAPEKDAVLGQDAIRLARYGLRTDAWKFIVDLKTSQKELYDLRQDPGETNNLLAANAANAADTADAGDDNDVATELETRLRRSIRDNQTLHKAMAGSSDSGTDLLTPEERERLKSLGYLD